MQFRRLAYSIRRIDASNITTLSTLALPVGLQDRISPSPAEPNRPNLVRAGYHAYGIDEAVDQRPRHTLTVFDEPRTQSGRHYGGVFGFVDYAKSFLRLEGRFDIVEKRNRQRVALMEIRHVGVEARFGVCVGQQSDVGEFVAEDWVCVLAASARLESK